jgi:diguanylate cyclase (GGDEF)-like protein
LENPVISIFWLFFAMLLIPPPCLAEMGSGDAELQNIDFQLRRHHQFQFAGYYAAIEKGYYREEGLAVHLHEGAPGRTPVREVLAGRAQYAEANGEVLLARLNGAPLVALAAIFQHSPSVLLARGKADAFSAYLTDEPFYLQQRGIGFTVIAPKDYGIDFYSDILFTSEQELKAHPERVKAFRRATLKGWRYALERSEEIIDLLLRKYPAGKTRAHLQFEAKTMRDAILPDLIDVGHMNPARWRRMADTFVKTGMAAKNSSLEGFIYDSDPSQDVEKLWQAIFMIGAVAGVFFVISVVLMALQRRLKKEIQRRIKAELEIRNVAFYDPLTKLPNRRLLFERLQQALSVSTRRKTYGAILFLDLDNFKILNDTRGHDVGDLLLVEAARRLQTCVREDDTVARLGGDEFVLMLESLDKDSQHAATLARNVGEKVLNALSRPYFLNGQEFLSSSSIGISLFIDHKDSPEDLLKRSDTAMYQAKFGGRNTLRFFDPAMQQALEERFRFEMEIRLALQNREYRLCYQIQVDDRRRPVGAEVLLRWQHPQHGLLLPRQFLPLAEEAGLSAEIGLWVLESACAQLRDWQSRPHTRDLSLAVNVCTRQFHHPDFVTHVRDILRASGSDPAKLTIELTERMVQDDLQQAIGQMRLLKRAGVRFSLDDFGIGYSSLNLLKKLPLDQLKIDVSLVHDLTKDARVAAIVQAIINMGKTLGYEVIAEGVETEEQFSFLTQNGCLVFQGYLFGNLKTGVELTN